MPTTFDAVFRSIAEYTSTEAADRARKLVTAMEQARTAEFHVETATQQASAVRALVERALNAHTTVTARMPLNLSPFAFRHEILRSK